jgi:peptidoglycan/LPS O-acetylase OafA/YrhL
MEHLKYRPDIDGLRAIAILSVLAYHAFPNLIGGGFVGVDIFFVISGYLITGIIIKSIHKNSYSIIEFYERRVNRIFPALLLVLTSSLIFGWFVLTNKEYQQLGLHTAGGAGFIANIILYHETGYFDVQAELKPLLHLWSLGIEEQFYIIWPLIIWGSLRLKLNIKTIVTALSVVFFISSAYWIQIDRNGAFYLPFFRMWELSTGAFVYIYKHEKEQSINNRHTEILSSIGIAMLFASIILFNKETKFPGLYALIPVIGAALVIGNNLTAINSKIISSRWLVNIGLISYPIYLWHWPILSFSRIINGGSISTQWTLASIIITIALSILTYRIIERPLRNKVRWQKTAGLIIAMAIIGGLGHNIYQREGLPFRYKQIISMADNYKRDFMGWGELGLIPDRDCQHAFYFPKQKICLQNTPDLPPTVAIIGDSHAFHAYWGLSNLLLASNENLIIIGRGACIPFLGSPLSPDGNICHSAIEKSISYALSTPTIHTIVLTHRGAYLNKESSIHDVADFKDAMHHTFNKIGASGKNIIYVMGIPEPGVNPRLCVGDLPLGRKRPSDSCQYPVEKFLSDNAVYRNAALQVIAQHPYVKVIDPHIYLCPLGTCSVIQSNHSMYMDENHLSQSGSTLIGREIGRLIINAKKHYPDKVY